MSMMNGYDGCNNKNDYLCVGGRYRFLSLHFTLKFSANQGHCGQCSGLESLAEDISGLSGAP